MRSTIVRTALLAAALSLPAAASAQVSPFSIDGAATERGRTGDGASGLPDARSPAVQQDIAEQEASGMSPTNPRTTSNARGRSTAPEREGPPPFDINEDGVAPPPVVLPEEEQELFRPSTTVSTLSNNRAPARVMPMDATSREEREDLNLLLKQDSDSVRELRVVVDNEEEWVDSVVDRPIVPYRVLRLDGEIDYASWNFFISGAEAARGGTLSIAFTNSVLVLPEASRLRVFLNGRQIAQTAIDSPDRTKIIALPISPDLLRPGENALRIEAEMRHRIDCSLDATYELWTRIDTRLTGFSFPGGRITMSGIADLPGVGVGTSGATRIRILQPGAQSITSVDRMLRAAQAAALRGRFVQPLVEVVGLQRSPAPAPGTLNIVIGTYDQVRSVMGVVPSEGSVGPLTALIDTPELGPTVFIVGPNERAVDTALARFDMPDGPGTPRSPIAATPPWLVPDSVPIEAADTVTLREAGVETINFSGRRFMTSFQVTLPPDFYAAAYGEATLYLDAAYSAEVEPGSRLSVFVNGILSTAVSFTETQGEVFENFPIVLGMQAFRPGVNKIEIVADLNTEADRACLPGGTVPARDRFALFSSTRLVFPSFARIGQLPNLASFATNGFPYPLNDAPVRVHVANESLDTVGAAGTLMSRIAVSRGAPLSTSAVESVNPFGDTGVIVVAPLNDVSSVALEATGAASVIPSTWLQPYPTSRPNGEPEGLERYDAVLRRLRQQLRQEEVRLDRSAAEDIEMQDRVAETALDQRNETERTRERWFEELQKDRGISGLLSESLKSVREALNIDFGLGRRADTIGDITPVAEGASLILAQARAPQNASTAWTLVTAPTAGLLSTSVAAISAPDNWNRIGGRITAYDLQNDTIETIEAEEVSYLATLPLSFSNFRLIAANWFSINNGIYSLVLIVVAILLGFVTWMLVSPLGRKG